MTSPSPSPASFTVSVPDVGDFTFRRRTIGDDLKIMAAYDRLTGGLDNPTPLLDSLASALATYRILCVGYPAPEWAPARVEQMDTLADDRTAQLLTVFGALSAREDEFRPPAKRRFAPAGQGAAQQPGDVVPAEIPPPAHGPEVPLGDA